MDTNDRYLAVVIAAASLPSGGLAKIPSPDIGVFGGFVVTESRSKRVSATSSQASWSIVYDLSSLCFIRMPIIPVAFSLKVPLNFCKSSSFTFKKYSRSCGNHANRLSSTKIAILMTPLVPSARLKVCINTH